MVPDPQKMVAQYLKSGSSADFEKIVITYSRLVFGTAMRKTGNSILAEEITQEVFITLAQKIGTIRETHKLSGWLHRTTLYLAANAIRKESRRRNSMKAYLNEASRSEGVPVEDEKWQRALPVLDEVIDQLPSRDREAVMMRFYDGVSFKAIGRKVGKSEDASRKQVLRALEKIARLLKKKGVIIPPATLGVMLGGCLTRDLQALPTSSIAQLATSASSSTPFSLSSQALLVMSQYKISFIVASCALFIPVAMEWQKSRNEQGAASGDQPLESGVIHQASLRKSTRSSRQVSPRTQEELLVVLEEISELKQRFRREAQLENLMLNLKKSELQPALEALKSSSISHRNFRYQAQRLLFNRWARLDVPNAIEVSGSLENQELRRAARYGVVEGWVLDDPVAVDDFLANLPEGAERENLTNYRWHEQSYHDPEAAAPMVLQIADEKERYDRLGTVVDGFAARDPSAGIEFVNGLEEGITKDKLLEKLIESLSKEKPQEGYERAVSLLDGPPLKSTLSQIIGEWAEVDAEQAYQAIIELPAEDRDVEVISKYAEGLTDYGLVTSQLSQLGNERERSAFVAGLADGLNGKDFESPNLTKENITQVRELVEKLPPGEDRFQARWNLARAWASRDYEAAVDWYQSQPGVKESMKDKFERLFRP